MIHELFPDGVVTVEAEGRDWDGFLYPEEKEIVRSAVHKRRREFTAGRVAARRALGLLGIEGFPLLAGADRLVVWPEGVIGSISHCEEYCGVAVARAGRLVSLGLDVERAGPLDPSSAALVCTPEEMAHLETLPAPATEGGWSRLVFSAKESVYKCLYPLTRRMLEFHEVEVLIDPLASTFTARVTRAGAPIRDQQMLRGRFAATSSHIFSAVTLLASEIL